MKYFKKPNQIHTLSDNALGRFKEIPVLMYHRVVEAVPMKNSKFKIYITKDKLDWQLGNLKKRGFNFITFKDISNGVEVKKPIILTFDDGYEDNYTNLLPLLKKNNAKAVIYCLANSSIEPDLLNERMGYQNTSLMSSKQIKKCHDSKLVEIGSHGLSHSYLTGLTRQEVHDELKQSKDSIEKIIEDSVVSFAYPYGCYGKREKELACEIGYSFAVGISDGPIKMTDDYYGIRRISIFFNIGKFSFWKKTSGFYFRLLKLKGGY